jgi:ATP-dependent RNA helicase DDX51/DBP6
MCPTDLGFKELFPVQCAVWREMAGGLSDSHDLCVACPTGSGKTLAYALPLVNALTHGRTVAQCHRLQALVVLPTRDLASQVHSVLHALCPSVGLMSGLASGGGKSLEQEARCLIDPPSWLNGSANEAQRCVDVLVATPGRLVAHLEGTEGFVLDHLRFLVVDETDRLLRQAYSDWLPKVLALLSSGSSGFDNLGERRRVVKLVVSATLTRDPSKLKRLDLHCPRYIAASSEDHRYHLPRQLEEYKV